MTELGPRNLLLIGVDITSLARSAKRAGYKVYAVDYFGDQDLRRFSDDFFSVIDQMEGGSCGRLNVDFDAETLLEGAKEISNRNRIDAILLSTGLDDSPGVLYELSMLAPIVGNSPKLIRLVRNREEFFRELKRLHVPAPQTALVEGFPEASSASKDIGFPLLVKPVEGFGGADITKVENPDELRRSLQNSSRESRRIIIQEYIPGLPASASVVSSKNKSVTLTANEQITGYTTYGQMEPFGYCGNIVPLSVSEGICSKCKELAEEVITHFELVGSNGVDFVISRDGVPHVIEVNPRFQGTLECVEKVLGLNLVETHVNACAKGVLPKAPNLISRYCTRLILFALHQSIAPDLSRYPEVRDIPFPGVIIEKGEPVCSIVAEGEDRDSSFNKAKSVADMINRSLRPIEIRRGPT